MKRILVAFVMVAVCGCTSYRFTGSVDGASMANGVKTKGKYRICKLSFDVKRGLNQQIRDSQGDSPFAMPDPWSSPQVASASREACLIEMIHATHPDVFSSVSTAIPLEIKVQGGRENKDYGWSVLCPYLITLGIAPAFFETRSECNAEVRIVDGQMLDPAVGLSFCSNMRMTAFSPFGLIEYEDRMSGVQSQAVGSGVAAWPHGNAEVLKQLQKVFSSTLADAVLRAIIKHEAACKQ